MPNYRVIVMTSDKYIEALRPFAHLFNRYWSPSIPVLVAGYTPPEFELPANFSFMSIGRFEDYPLNKWSDSLIKVCDMLQDEVFVLMLEDYWVIRKVDTEAVSILADYVRQFGYVLKIDLCADRLYAAGATPYGWVNRLDLVKSDPSSAYHMSLMTGIWHRKNLRSVLVPGWTPWDVEISGTTHLQHVTVHPDGTESMIVLGTRQWPVRHTLAFRGGDIGTIYLDELSPRDSHELAGSGMLDKWLKRGEE